jgi:hypothetical protein
MRKIATALLLILSVAATAFAADIGVSVDGRALSLDQGPVVSGGRVLVPLRGIFEAMGANVHYNPADRSVDAQRGATQLHLVLDSTQATLNGRPVTLDVPAQTIGGRTLVPIRFVSEALGAHVDWNAAARAVAITSPNAPSASIAPPEPPAPVVLMPPPPPPAPQISRMTTDATGMLHPGNRLHVTMMGTPGGTATFDVANTAQNVAMTETRPGVYEGDLTIRPDNTPSTEPRTVTGHLTLNGQTASQDAQQQIAIGPTQGNIFVNVTSPSPSQVVSRDFEVTGTTLPFATVKVKAQEYHHTLIVFGAGGDEVSATGKADANGHFSVPVHMPVQGRHNVSLKVTAVDSKGNVSKPMDYGIAVGND